MLARVSELDTAVAALVHLTAGSGVPVVNIILSPAAHGVRPRLADRHLKRRDEMVGRFDGAAGMDLMDLSGSLAERAAMTSPAKRSRSVMSLKGLFAIEASRSGTGRAIVCGGGDTPGCSA
jgi:hypothetical protein